MIFYYRKALIKLHGTIRILRACLHLWRFLCIGNCYPGNFSSLPFNVSLKPEEAGRYGAPCSVSCYFPMPFNKKAKLRSSMKMTFRLFYILILIMNDTRNHWMRTQHTSMLPGIGKIPAMDGDRIFRSILRR